MSPWHQTIDETTRAFVAHFGGLTTSQLNWKPGPDTWSIAQNIDHLIVINRTYYPVLDQLQAGTYRVPWFGKLGFIVRFMGRIILDSVKPDQQRKIKTFPIWQPSSSAIPGDILDRFAVHQSELKDRISSVGDWIQAGAVICSPANRNIVYTLSTAFDIIVNHEQRHLEQAKRILVLLREQEVQ